MSKRTEISASLVKAGESVTEAKTHAGEAVQAAQDLMDQAAEHGWDGVASTMQEAVEALERAVEHLGTVETSGETAVTRLDEITDKMSSPEVVDHLAAAITELDSAGVALEGTTTEVDEASEACQRAGEPETLLQLLQALKEESDEVQERIKEIRDATEDEREQGENYGNQ